MSVVAESSGTLSTTGGGTEDFLDNIPTVGEFTLHVDRSDMVDGDVIVVRLYQMVLAGGTARVVQARTYYGAPPADEQIVVLGPIANELTDANALRASVTQTLGTAGVSLPWKVLNIGAALRPTTVNRTLDVSATGEADANVAQWLGTAAATPTVAGVPEVDLTHVAGSTTSVSALASGVATLLADWLNGGRLDLILDIIAADTTTDIPALIAALQAFVDTEVAAIKAVTDALPDAGALTTIQADLDNIQTRIPAALVSGRIDASVGAMASGVVTATAIAANAIGTSELADGAITAAKIATGAIDADAIAADAATEIAEAAMSALVETGLTLREAQRLFAAVLLSKVSGAGTTTIVFRDVGDTKDRVTATVDVDGNRSAVTLDDT